MKKLYPLKFHPILKDKIWGGQKLKDLMSLDFGTLPNCGELWLISGIPDNETKVINGWLRGNDIAELCEVFMGDLMGEKVFETYDTTFPLLFKIIDANDDLSIQVHPNDELSKKIGEKFGKTEMWYILQAEKNAQLISGFETKIDEDKLRETLKNGNLVDILHFENVNQGDVFYTPAGRVHAICKGIVLAEIQQSSDITYRLFDWNRLNEKGQRRHLHINESLYSIDYDDVKSYRMPYNPKKNSSVPMVKCSQFVTNFMDISAPILKNFEEIDSFVVYLCTEGSFSVKFENETTNIKYGEVVLIPNNVEEVEFFPNGKASALEVYVP